MPCKLFPLSWPKSHQPFLLACTYSTTWKRAGCRFHIDRSWQRFSELRCLLNEWSSLQCCWSSTLRYWYECKPTWKRTVPFYESVRPRLWCQTFCYQSKRVFLCTFGWRTSSCLAWISIDRLSLDFTIVHLQGHCLLTCLFPQDKSSLRDSWWGLY